MGDLFDGIAARRFNQCSTLGGLIDMLLDRCTTAGLTIILIMLYEQVWIKLLLILLIWLDFTSHWFQMYYCSLSRSHHKKRISNNSLISRYHNDYYFFGYLCIGLEFTYIILYLLKILPYNIILYIGLIICSPAFLMKIIVSLYQLFDTSYLIAEYDQYGKNL